MMASWDEVKGKISWMGKASVVKTRTAARIVTVDGKISDARKKVDESLLALGRCLYELDYAEDSVEDIEELIKEAEADGEDIGFYEAVLEVKRNEAQLEGLIEEKEILKGIKPCRVCGEEITADSAFCRICGTRVDQDEDSEYEPEDSDEETDEDISDEEADEDADADSDSDSDEEEFDEDTDDEDGGDPDEEDDDEEESSDPELPAPVEVKVDKNDEAAEKVVNVVTGDMAEDVKRYLEDDEASDEDADNDGDDEPEEDEDSDDKADEDDDKDRAGD